MEKCIQEPHVTPEELRRRKLQDILSQICDNVYFQPPSTVKLCYPCIIYSISTGDTSFADNKTYSFRRRYSIMLISDVHEHYLIEQIAALPMTTYDRRYVTDNLYHDTFYTYF